MNSYWVNRGLKIANEDYINSNDIIKDINKEFGRAMMYIERDISFYLERIANDNNLSYIEARKRLKEGEFDVFRMSLQEYINKAEGVLNEHTIKELVNASNLHNISRLQAMGFEMKKHIDYLYNTYAKSTENLINRTYEKNFYSSLYELQSFTGYETIRKIDSDVLNKIIKKPWTADGKNFSARIWEQQEKLINELQSVLMQKCIIGTDTKKLIDELSKRMGVSFSKAKRLIQTENSYFSNKALADSYQKGNCKQYEILATLDLKTSNICRQMDGKKFKFTEMKEGINAPPFHCNCRSVIIPAYNDEIEQELDELAGRVARNPVTGKTEYVSNMKYDEWYKRYVTKTTDLGYNITIHLVDRMEERGISLYDINKTIKNPLDIKERGLDAKGRPSVRYIGNTVTVNVNPENKNITTVWKTGRKTRKKYEK